MIFIILIRIGLSQIILDEIVFSKMPTLSISMGKCENQKKLCVPLTTSYITTPLGGVGLVNQISLGTLLYLSRLSPFTVE